MKRRRYGKVEDGTWFRPLHRDFRHACCDCCLVHRVDMRVAEDGAIEMRFIRDNRATAAARRPFQFEKE